MTIHHSIRPYTIIGEKIDPVIVEDINKKMISMINDAREIMRLYFSPSTADYAKELASYLLVDDLSTARRGYSPKFLFDYDADGVEELSDTSLVLIEIQLSRK